MNQYCETYIKLSKDALKHNAKFFKETSHKKLIAVIKSNAYGHGLLEVASVLKTEADLFAVASLDSAIALRKAHIELPILVLNPLNIEYVEVAANNDIMITISSLSDAEAIEKSYQHLPKKVLVHIKIDSGMNRMGLKSSEEYQAILNLIEKSTILKAVGVYTHFHSPDNPIYSKNQQENFLEIYQSMPYDFKYVHLCSTSATLNNLDIKPSTHVRIGLGLYGLCDNIQVKPVLSMYSKVVIEKEVKKGETVGYSANFKAYQNAIIGVLPLGYSDGIIRKNTGRKVYIDGNFCDIIGNVCMNSMMISLPNKGITGDVEIIGPHIKAIYIAKHLQTISYEVTTILPPHIKRIVE